MTATASARSGTAPAASAPASPLPRRRWWSSRWPRYLVRGVALTYLLLLLALPVLLVFYRTFEKGLGPVLKAIQQPAFQHAFWLTMLITAIAVPLNTIFGVLTALMLVRRRFPGRRLLDMAVDLPFAISPVVIGLALILVYGKFGWFGGWLAEHGITVIFALPGMILATIFVSLPFVACRC